MPKCSLANDGTLLYLCPGCKSHHGVNAERWNWNKDVDSPTLSPSVKHTFPDGKVCHYFIRGGVIDYCGDCHHELNGQSYILPDMED